MPLWRFYSTLAVWKRLKAGISQGWIQLWLQCCWWWSSSVAAPSSSHDHMYHDMAAGSASFHARLAFSFEITASRAPFPTAFPLRVTIAHEQLVEEEHHVQSTLRQRKCSFAPGFCAWWERGKKKNHFLPLSRCIQSWFCPDLSPCRYYREAAAWMRRALSPGSCKFRLDGQNAKQPPWSVLRTILHFKERYKMV